MSNLPAETGVLTCPQCGAERGCSEKVCSDCGYVGPQCWVLARTSVNAIQAESIGELIQLSKRAHFVNVRVRIDGDWIELDADWLKHLEPQP